MDTRNEQIDFLRFAGLVIIIFAHVSAPKILLMPGAFAVPLMVVVSAMSYLLSEGKNKSYMTYFWSRIKRLILPTWCFLILYFAVIYFFKIEYSELNFSTVLETFFLLDGIGYVWIIRVFLLVALVAPFLVKFNNSFKSDSKYLLTLLGLFALHSIMLFFTEELRGEGVYKYASYIIDYIIPYSLIFAFGLRFQTLSLNTLKTIALLCLLGSIALGTFYYLSYDELKSFFHYKFPPQAFYLFYSIFGVIVTYILSGYIWPIIKNIGELRNVVLFMARNSLWIYLWHIPIVTFLSSNFIFEFFVTLVGASLITYIQVKFINDVMCPRIQNDKLKYNLKVIFRG